MRGTEATTRAPFRGAAVFFALLSAAVGARNGDFLGRDTDPGVREWMERLEEDTLPKLSIDRDLALAAARLGLSPGDREVSLRERLLAAVFPDLDFGRDVVREMLRGETLVLRECADEGGAARAKAYSLYAATTSSIPDSLLPGWERMKDFLTARELRDQPICRTRLSVLADPEAFRADCDPAPDPAATDTGWDGNEARSWSPLCLLLPGPEVGACLVETPGSRECLLTVGEFNARASAYRISGVGDRNEARSRLMRAMLANRFPPRGMADRDGPGSRAGTGASLTPAPEALAVPFLASTDSQALERAYRRIPFRSMPREGFPPELRSPASDDGDAGNVFPRRTRTAYGWFLTASAQPPLKSAEGCAGLFRLARELERALESAPVLCERSFTAACRRSDAPFRLPDTLAYRLWLAPDSLPDTAGIRSLSIRSTSIECDLDSLAWSTALGLKGRGDTLIGPLSCRYGTAYLKTGRPVRARSDLRHSQAKLRFRRRLATGIAVGTALGLVPREPRIAAEPDAEAAAKIALPAFRSKDELAMATAELLFGHVDPRSPRAANLARMSERMLADLYRRRKQELDFSAWLEGLELSRQAAALGFRL